MNRKLDQRLTRREWARLSAGTLLALGAWPGCARWSGRREADAFRFAVLNDTHFQSPQCPAWFERVSASLRAQTPRPEFCLVVGDLAEHGTASELGAMRDVLRSFGMPCHAVMGNHDHASPSDRSAWDRLFPRSLNYHVEHRGWQFVGLDSTQGTQSSNTTIQPATLQWLDDHLRTLDPGRPTVVFTHFPLGAFVPMRPLNADALLDRFRDINLIAVFNGHFHAFTERHSGSIALTTNRCCAISRKNHDGSPEKGYFMCHAREGRIDRQFVEVKPT
jgi:hypothetical protein